MAETEAPVTTPPAAPAADKSAVEVFHEAVTAADAAPVAGAETPTAPAWDPKLIVIPKDAPLPAHFAKYGGKTLDEIIQFDLAGQRYGSEQHADNQRLRAENEKLLAKQAAREELAALLTPEKPAQTDFERVGITAETPVWDQPLAALEATRKLASEDAEKMVEARIKKALEDRDAKDDQERRSVALINTFEAAKAQIRAAGHTMTDDEWRTDILPYIVPRLAQEETVTPGIVYDPAVYVERFNRLRGAPPKPVIPAEGAPPMSSRTASITPQLTAPTASGELVEMKKKIADALSSQGTWTKDEAAAYVGGQ